MSKLTLEEAISHYLELAEQEETQADKMGRQFIGSAMDKCATDCRECAADHRQFTEWLMELKEAKRLLKAAVEDMNKEADCGICLHDNDGECPIEVAACKFKWRYTDKALALIGDK